MRRSILVLAMLTAATAAGCADDGGEPGFTPPPSPTGVPTASPTPSPTAGTHVVRVFFGAPDAAETDCAAVVAVERTTEGADVLHDAMEALLEGPTSGERAQGISSFFSRKTRGMLDAVRIEDGVAHVDFRDFSRVIPNASTSCGSAALLAQLDATATQFPTVREARYSFEGSEEAFYEWLQMSVPT
ncbi:MAG TPA: GerMN domain-containing protein [Actinomycetota bacterium]